MLQEAFDVHVGERDFAGIEFTWSFSSGESFVRLVDMMGVKVVHPQKPGLILLALIDPGDGFVAQPFGADLSVRLATLVVVFDQFVVVFIETILEAESFAQENVRADAACCVSAGTHGLCERGNFIAYTSAIIDCTVRARMAAGHQGRQARQGPGTCAPSLLEHCALFGQGVYSRSFSLGSIRAEMVGAQGVDGDDQ